MSPVIEVRPLSDVTHVIYRGDVVVVTGNSNAALLALTSMPMMLAAVRFFRWE